ncbi:hypothetical protein SLE2022_078840 [Rubroshorea leprosula]
MKQDSLVLIIVFLLFAFLLCSYPISASRLPPQNQGTEKGYMKFNEIVHQDGSLASTIKEDNFLNMMGLESESESVDCSEKDEECVKRRIIAEAHLDYVYTQKQHP